MISKGCAVLLSVANDSVMVAERKLSTPIEVSTQDNNLTVSMDMLCVSKDNVSVSNYNSITAKDALVTHKDNSHTIARDTVSVIRDVATVSRDSRSRDGGPVASHIGWPVAKYVGAGLKNLGNTCFVNAIVQCLTYTTPLVRFLFAEKHSTTKCSCLFK